MAIDTAWLERLKDRAMMLASVRSFFATRHVTEVDCPVMAKRAPIDACIGLFSLLDEDQHRAGFLLSSPEHPMKRLLAAGIGDIYQLSHVYRAGEIGHAHNPEFAMIEWYRLGMDLDSLKKETIELIALFVGDQKVTRYTYQTLFQKLVGLDPFVASALDFFQRATELGLGQKPSDSIQGWLDFFWVVFIDPYLQEQNGMIVVEEFMPHQAGQAKVGEQGDGLLVAKRFEIYVDGLECANGYDELQEALPLKQRWKDANAQRKKAGQKPLPPDTALLKAMATMPRCSGVAAGFDRLMMARHRCALSDIFPFAWGQL